MVKDIEDIRCAILELEYLREMWGKIGVSTRCEMIELVIDRLERIGDRNHGN